MPRTTSAGAAVQGQGGYVSGGYTTQFPVVSLPPVPTYPSATTRHTTTLPPRKVLASLGRPRPRWGLRFFFLLVFAGVGAYYARPYIPWIDTRVTAVEDSIRDLGRQYGFLDGAPAPLARPSGDLPAEPAPVAAAPAADVALARANAGRPGGTNTRPDIQPLGAQPPGAKAPGAGAAVPGRVPAAVVGGAVPAGKVGRAGYGRRKLAAAGPGATPRPRFRRRARAAAAVAAAPAAAEATPVVEAPKAAAAPAKPAAAPAAAPAPAKAAPAAAPGGDELDQLMASAVGPGKGGSDLDKKLATVQKGEPKGVKTASVSAGAPPLDRAEIQTVMRDVQKELGECAKAGPTGPVDVKVEVAPEGDVKSTVIRGDLAGTPAGACVESKIKAAVFPPSSGMRFDYRLVVR